MRDVFQCERYLSARFKFCWKYWKEMRERIAMVAAGAAPDWHWVERKFEHIWILVRFLSLLKFFCTNYKCEIYFGQSKNIKCCWCSHCIRCLVNLKHGEQHSLRNPVSFRLERYLGVERYQCAFATLSNVYLYLCIYIGIFVYLYL